MKAVPLLLALALPGLLVAEEAGTKPSADERLARILEQFPDSDANGDGVLTREEALAYRDRMKASRGSDRKGRTRVRVEPTHADVAYGDHERHRFDLWIPGTSRDGRPFPLLVYFHGGGFVAGDKSSFDPASYLAAGIACASVNYRFVDGTSTLSPVPMRDSARALQTILHRAAQWNLDPGRVALSGGSAGAVITLWIGYHDDLADPGSDDPVARQSTRVDCLLPINGPTNLDPAWIHENLGGPPHVHGSFAKLFGEPVSGSMRDETRALIAEASPWSHLDEGDPPTFLAYSGPLDELPLPETVTTGKLIHHPGFGAALKTRLDELGIENEFRHGFDPRGKPTLSEWLQVQFRMVD